ncbi:hypothetical protein Tco_0621860 [Tanacetum coccineum]
MLTVCRVILKHPFLSTWFISDVSSTVAFRPLIQLYADRKSEIGFKVLSMLILWRLRRITSLFARSLTVLAQGRWTQNQALSNQISGRWHKCMQPGVYTNLISEEISRGTYVICCPRHQKGQCLKNKHVPEIVVTFNMNEVEDILVSTSHQKSQCLKNTPVPEIVVTFNMNEVEDILVSTSHQKSQCLKNTPVPEIVVTFNMNEVEDILSHLRIELCDANFYLNVRAGNAKMELR